MAELRVIKETPYVALVERSGWTFVTRPGVTGIVTVVAVTERDELVLVEQFRDPLDRPVLELPAGLVGDEAEHEGESLETAARRELLEETGYTCEELTLLGEGATSPGITDEILTVFRAHGVRRVGEGGGVGGERITVHTVPLAGLRGWLASCEEEGAVVDLKLFGALHLAGLSTGA